MKKSLILILSVTTFVLFSAGFGSADDKAICPLNKSIYMSEATKEIFAVKQYARRVRYKCFEYTEKKDNEYIGRKESFEFTTNFDYPKYDKFIQHANLQCKWSWWAEMLKGVLEGETVYYMMSGMTGVMPCCEGISYSQNEIDEARLFEKNPQAKIDNSMHYWAKDDELADFYLEELNLYHPLNWDLGPMGKGPYKLVGCQK